MLVVGMQSVTAGWNSISHWNDLVGGLSSQLSVNSLVLAQTVNDPNVLGQMQKAFDNFIQTGQVWALIIGIVIGYMFRSFTSF